MIKDAKEVEIKNPRDSEFCKISMEDANLDKEIILDYMCSLSKYTKKEIDTLNDFILRNDINCELAYIILTEPLEDIPLYINNEDFATKKLVDWRLKTGK